MWISGGESTLYADRGVGRRARHKCYRGRKKGGAKDGGASFKSVRKENRCRTT